MSMLKPYDSFNTFAQSVQWKSEEYLILSVSEETESGNSFTVGQIIRLIYTRHDPVK